MTTSLPPFVRLLAASLWDVGSIEDGRWQWQRRDEEGEAAEMVFGKLVVSPALQAGGSLSFDEEGEAAEMFFGKLLVSLASCSPLASWWPP